MLNIWLIGSGHTEEFYLSCAVGQPDLTHDNGGVDLPKSGKMSTLGHIADHRKPGEGTNVKIGGG